MGIWWFWGTKCCMKCMTTLWWQQPQEVHWWMGHSLGSDPIRWEAAGSFLLGSLSMFLSLLIYFCLNIVMGFSLNLSMFVCSDNDNMTILILGYKLTNFLLAHLLFKFACFLSCIRGFAILKLWDFVVWS